MNGDLARLLDELEQAEEAAALGSLRAGQHYGIHLYAGESPVGTTHRAADAALIVAAVNALPRLIAELRRRDAALAAVRELASDYAFMGAVLHDVPRAETFAQAANDLRAALAAHERSNDKETER